MGLNVGKEIADLKQMTVRELREKYETVFGEPTRAGKKDFLFKRIAWRTQALAEGDLSERAGRRAEFLARDADLRTTAPRMPPTTIDARTPPRSGTRCPSVAPWREIPSLALRARIARASGPALIRDG